MVTETKEITVRDEYDKSMISLKDVVEELNHEVENDLSDMNRFAQLLDRSSRYMSLDSFKDAANNSNDGAYFGNDLIQALVFKMYDGIKAVENTEYFKNMNKPVDEDMRNKLLELTEAVQEVRDEAQGAFDDVECEYHELDEMKSSVPFEEGYSIRDKINSKKDVSESEAESFLDDVACFVNERDYGMTVDNYAVSNAFEKLEALNKNLQGE